MTTTCMSVVHKPQKVAAVAVNEFPLWMKFMDGFILDSHARCF